jgi:hypothetical protein
MVKSGSRGQGIVIAGGWISVTTHQVRAALYVAGFLLRFEQLLRFFPI